jgi:LysM repeat protein
MHKVVVACEALIVLAFACGNDAGQRELTATVVPSPEATSSHTAEEPGPQPFVSYLVKDGDTVASIASAHGIEERYVLAANADLAAGASLVVGRLIVVPAGNGLVYHIRYGETLREVAERFEVSIESILAWPGNAIRDVDSDEQNEILFIPGGVLPTPAP